MVTYDITNVRTKIARSTCATPHRYFTIYCTLSHVLKWFIFGFFRVKFGFFLGFLGFFKGLCKKCRKPILPAESPRVIIPKDVFRHNRSAGRKIGTV